MADIESLLNRVYESEQASPAGITFKRIGWQGMVALILGAILLACGVVLFVSAHWDQIGPGARYLLVIAMVAVFHLGGAWARERYHGLSTALHAVGTVSTGAAIALVGQIFNIQEHWPGAVLLWAIAAAAGWILLRDQAQQILTLLVFPRGYSLNCRSPQKATSARTSTSAASSSPGRSSTSLSFSVLPAKWCREFSLRPPLLPQWSGR